MSVQRFKQDTEAEARRSMLRRIQSQPEKSLDEIQDEFMSEIEVLDPELASLMKESVARAGHAAMAKIRHQGYEVPASEFELRRDENDLKNQLFWMGRFPIDCKKNNPQLQAMIPSLFFSELVAGY